VPFGRPRSGLEDRAVAKDHFEREDVLGQRHAPHPRRVLRQPAADGREVARQRAEVGNAIAGAGQRLAQVHPARPVSTVT
jgi:hypothetical protein